jgi:hypothetical protein
MFFQAMFKAVAVRIRTPALVQVPGRVAAAPADRTVVCWAASWLLSMTRLQAVVKPAAAFESLMEGVFMARQGQWPA